MDTPAEERFDRVTRLVNRLFNVPVSRVSLVDSNRQWFKSCFGLPVLETDRDISFCGHTILDDCVLVIENALEDERFSDNPLVTGEPNIRFYAGFPLRMPNGMKMGTLCLIDDQPRVFTKEDEETLKDLASMVVDEHISTQLATIDELTMISNRRGFLELSQKGISQCNRHNERAILLYLDLDHFKAINDNYGHDCGDKALIEFSKMLSQVFRETDIFGRLGGDEFAVLISDASESSVEEIEALTTCFIFYPLS